MTSSFKGSVHGYCCFFCHSYPLIFHTGTAKMPPITRKRKRETERAAFNCLMIENMGNFKVLPAEIMEIVLSSLDAPSLSSLSCTCKKLHEYTQKSWKTLCDRLALDYTPTPLCLASRSAIPVVYQYDIALHKCTSDVSKWRIMAIRQWLYCHWKCVVCYRSCTRRSDPHRDILLCESCHPVFYKRKSSAKVTGHLRDYSLSQCNAQGSIIPRSPEFTKKIL